MTTRTLRLAAPTSLSSETLVFADGSIWSHAATLGTHFKDGVFSIDKATIENMTRVFATGYPKKVPVDYEHGTTSGASQFGQPIPKAGDVLELKGVFAPSDFAGDLKTVAEKLSAKAERPLDDPRNLGLWIRWRPTARALGMIKGGEYSELSVAFNPDMPHNADGHGQGPALYAVALTNLPFLDDMLPVAASRAHDGGGGPDDPATSREGKLMKTTVLSLVAAIAGQAVTSDEDAVAQLQQLQGEFTRVRQFAKDVGAAIGETDSTKAVEKITKLRNDSEKLATELAVQKAAKIKTQVDAELTKHEKRVTPATKEYFAKQLTRELESGVAIEASETVKAIAALPEHKIAERGSGADAGAGAPSGEKEITRARELMRSPELVELEKKSGYSAAWREANKRAAKEMGVAVV